MFEPRPERRLRVWIFNHYASAPDASAGTRHFDLATRLQAMGVDTTIFAAGFSHFTLRDERLRRHVLSRSEYIDGVRFIWLRTIPYRGNGLLRILNMLSYWLVVQIEQWRLTAPDVVIGSTVHPFAALAGEGVARHRRACFIYEIRDLWPQTLIDMGVLREEGGAARALRAIERRLVHRADAVVTVLPGAKTYLAERGYRPRVLKYIPNGSSPTHQPTADADHLIRLMAGWKAQGFVVFGYVGSHGAANGLSTLLDAANSLRLVGSPRCKILLVGDGPEKAALRSRARAECLDHVEFADPIPKAAVQPLLKYLDAGIFHLRPNAVFRYGVSSNKLFDYMAARLPVVFACTGAYDPVAAADAGISVSPDDGAALARAMAIIGSMTPDARARMGERGRAYVAQEHDLDLLATDLHRLLRWSVA